MKKTAILFALALAGVAACDSLVSDIDGVQTGRLELDKGATIGDTFDSYSQVQQPGTWTKSIERGKTFVTWTAKIKTQQPQCVAVRSGEGLACNVTGIIGVTFVVLPDNAFQVTEAEVQLHAASLDGKTTDDRVVDDAARVLKAIYANELPWLFRLYPQ